VSLGGTGRGPRFALLERDVGGTCVAAKSVDRGLDVDRLARNTSLEEVGNMKVSFGGGAGAREVSCRGFRGGGFTTSSAVSRTLGAILKVERTRDVVRGLKELTRCWKRMVRSKAAESLKMKVRAGQKRRRHEMK